MLNKYTTFLFDLDGTLTDPGLGITNSVAYALNKWGIEVDDRTSLYKFIGPPLVDSFSKYYNFDEKQCRKAVDYYREYYSVKGLFENQIYDGIDILLAELKARGKKVVLATSKPDGFAIQILEHFDIMKYFDFIGGATMDEKRTKKTEVIEYVLNNIEEKDLSKIVMIGDREYDILGARQYNLDSIGVLFGYGTLEELKKSGATYIAKSTKDLYSLIIND